MCFLLLQAWTDPGEGRAKTTERKAQRQRDRRDCSGQEHPRDHGRRGRSARRRGGKSRPERPRGVHFPPVQRIHRVRRGPSQFEVLGQSQIQLQIIVVRAKQRTGLIARGNATGTLLLGNCWCGCCYGDAFTWKGQSPLYSRRTFWNQATNCISLSFRNGSLPCIGLKMFVRLLQGLRCSAVLEVLASKHHLALLLFCTSYFW